MPKVFLVHGWDGNPDNNFFPWLKQELESRDYEVEALSMPTPDAPNMETWIPTLAEAIGTPDQDTIIVGHSMGGATVLRYLEQLPEGIEINKAILVAPVVDIINNVGGEEEAKIAKPWLETPMDFAKIKRGANKIVGIFSDNDEFIPLSSAELIKGKIDAKITIEHNMGHFDDGHGVKEVPSVINAVLEA